VTKISSMKYLSKSILQRTALRDNDAFSKTFRTYCLTHLSPPLSQHLVSTRYSLLPVPAPSSHKQHCDATSSYIDLCLHWHSFWVTSIQGVLVGNWIRLHGSAALYCVNTTTWMVIIHMRTKGNLFHSILTELRIRTNSAASILTIFAIRAWMFNPKARVLPLTESSLPAPGITD